MVRVEGIDERAKEIGLILQNRIKKVEVENELLAFITDIRVTHDEVMLRISFSVTDYHLYCLYVFFRALENLRIRWEYDDGWYRFKRNQLMKRFIIKRVKEEYRKRIEGVREGFLTGELPAIESW